MKKLLSAFVSTILVFGALLSFRLPEVLAAEDVYFVEGWVFVDVDGDGLFNYLYDYPLIDERVDWVNLNTNTPGWVNTTNGMSQINGFYLDASFSESIFPLLGRSYSINYAPDQHTKGYYGVNYPGVLKVGTDENDPTEVKHVNNAPFPQRVKTFYIRDLDCYGGLCGNQDFINPPSPNYARFKGKDQGKGAGTNNIVVNFMIQRPPDAFSASAAASCNLTNPQITVSWNRAAYVTPNGDPGGNNYYQLYRSTTGQAGSFTPIGPKVVNNIANYSYIDSEVTTGQTYYYYVLAYNANGSRQSDPAPYISTVAANCTTVLKVQPVVPNPAASFGLSGKQLSEGGKSYYNPMIVTLDIPGAAKSYVAFYDKYSGLQFTNSPTFLSDVQGRLNTNPKNGVLLAKIDGKIKIYDPQGGIWSEDICGNPSICVLKKSIYDNLNNKLYEVDTNDSLIIPNWGISFFSNFQSKLMYTAVYAEDGATPPVSSFTPDASPVPGP